MNRREALKAGGRAIAGLYLLPLATVGCNSETVATFVTAIGKDAAIFASYFGQSALGTQIEAAANLIATDITNWQNGSPSADAIQALNDFAQLINSISIPVNSPFLGIEDLILAAITGLLALIPSAVVASKLSPKTVAIFGRVQPMAIKSFATKDIGAAQKSFNDTWKSIVGTTVGLQLPK
jgi:hypothetical protein